ncbi:uncharacterized protein LOC136094189 [Hydra vulgaris]|uniref:uncharacterized protein LOC136094189 n=1 Tax=Hydra vulgaris TaxID=6087 RepID=UPI0032EA3C4A
MATIWNEIKEFNNECADLLKDFGIYLDEDLRHIGLEILNVIIPGMTPKILIQKAIVLKAVSNYEKRSRAGSSDVAQNNVDLFSSNTPLLTTSSSINKSSIDLKIEKRYCGGFSEVAQNNVDLFSSNTSLLTTSSLIDKSSIDLNIEVSSPCFTYVCYII